MTDDEPEKLLLTVRETAALTGLGPAHIRSLIQHVPGFPVIRVTEHRVLIPRGRLLRWLGEYHVVPSPTLASADHPEGGN